MWGMLMLLVEVKNLELEACLKFDIYKAKVGAVSEYGYLSAHISSNECRRGIGNRQVSPRLVCDRNS